MHADHFRLSVWLRNVSACGCFSVNSELEAGKLLSQGQNCSGALEIGFRPVAAEAVAWVERGFRLYYLLNRRLVSLLYCDDFCR